MKGSGDDDWCEDEGWKMWDGGRMRDSEDEGWDEGGMLTDVWRKHVTCLSLRVTRRPLLPGHVLF